MRCGGRSLKNRGPGNAPGPWVVCVLVSDPLSPTQSVRGIVLSGSLRVSVFGAGGGSISA